MRRALSAAAMLALACGQTPARAQSVSLVGCIGTQALLVIDGGAPQAMRPGEEARGVRVVSVGDGSAVVNVGRHTQELHLGANPVALGTPPGAPTVLNAQPNGQFVVDARINGHTVRMMVDTGATLVALDREQARALGLSLEGATATAVRTANGVVRALRLNLQSVRVGTVEQHNVQAVVQDAPLPIALLGMSFLRGLDLRHQGDRLVLQARP